MLSLEHRKFLKSEHGRKWLIEKSLENTPEDKNWQSFHTPYDFCEKMISKTDIYNKDILVPFNIEFLEVLIHKFRVLSNNITFLADCKLDFELATKYNVNTIIVNNIKDFQEEVKKMVTVNFYKITDKLTNESYIGCTTRLYQRIAYHFCKGDNITGEVNRRFKSYGCDKTFFDVEILSTVTSDSEELITEMEKNYMKKYNTLENGMNRASGNEGYPPRLAGPRLGDDYKRSLTIAIEEEIKDKLFNYCKENRINRSRLVEKILNNLEKEERKCNRTSKK